jgi:tripartite-type tricarboxylate transporter receptor subunit TctC
MMVALASDLAPMHKDGKLRVIATSDNERFAGLGDVPTFKESGIDIVGRGWFAVYGPANMQTATVERLNKTIVEILQSSEIRQRITALGLKPTGSSPAGLAAIQQADSAKWGPIIKASGFTLEQ